MSNLLIYKTVFILKMTNRVLQYLYTFNDRIPKDLEFYENFWVFLIDIIEYEFSLKLVNII